MKSAMIGLVLLASLVTKSLHATPLLSSNLGSASTCAMPAAPSDVASAAAMAEIRSGGANRDGPAPSRLDLACLDGANTHRP